MRTLYAVALYATLPLLCAPAMADPPNPPDLADTVTQAMQQATALTDATRADAAKTADRLSQAPAQALYDRYHPGGIDRVSAPGKPCAHPVAIEAGGLCTPPPGR